MYIATVNCPATWAATVCLRGLTNVCCTSVCPISGIRCVQTMVFLCPNSGIWCVQSDNDVLYDIWFVQTMVFDVFKQWGLCMSKQWYLMCSNNGICVCPNRYSVCSNSGISVRPNNGVFVCPNSGVTATDQDF